MSPRQDETVSTNGPQLDSRSHRAQKQPELDVTTSGQATATGGVGPDAQPLAPQLQGQGETTAEVGLPSPGDWKPNQTILEDYEVERHLGVGGYGKVYLVRSRLTKYRFAVKRLKLPESVNRRKLIDELRLWMDLPEHPHLATCRFFRTVEKEIVIFADYIDGGTLADAIRKKQLRGHADRLDLAIQFAWGLHAVHESGLVHQDVKPANALITATDRTLKVADFGLAGHQIRGESMARSTKHSHLVTLNGMTLAYCSPEQAAGRRLSRATDIWSWGVAVLELYTGEATWAKGVAAPHVLEELAGTTTLQAAETAIPPGVAAVLRRCFEKDPLDRWESLLAAAEALRCVYEEVLGQPYPRTLPRLLAQPGEESADAAIGKEQRVEGNIWTDPRKFLRKILSIVGKDSDPAEAERHPAGTGGSAKARAIRDIAVFEDVVQIHEHLLDLKQATSAA